MGWTTDLLSGGNQSGRVLTYNARAQMESDMTIDETIKSMPADAFAALGGGQIAYLRSVRSEDVHALFPQAPQLAPGLELWALLTAAGQPIMLTDSKAAALANAQEHDLQTVSVH